MLCDGGSWQQRQDGRRDTYDACFAAADPTPFDSYARKYDCPRSRPTRRFTGCAHHVQQTTIVDAMRAADARTLWFIGDSVLMQVAFVAGCKARLSEGGHGWHWTRPRWASHFPKNENAAGGVNCAVSAARRGAQICFLTAVGHHRSPTLVHALEMLTSLNLTRASDVAMLTPGAWRVESASQHAAIAAGLARLVARAHPRLPRVLYQEPLAAHFPTEHGFWTSDLPLPTKCVPFGRPHPAPPPAHEAARQALLNPQPSLSSLEHVTPLPPSRFAMLEGAWAWSAAVAVDAHPGNVCREQERYCTSDCTHYCVRSGVASALVDALARRLSGEWRAGAHAQGQAVRF